MPRGGEVTVAVTSDSDAWRVAFRNRGDVPGPVRPRFFDKYATCGKRGGTGLGTYSAMLVARAHGGTILLDTGAGATTLTVVLPRVEASLAAATTCAGIAPLDSASPRT